MDLFAIIRIVLLVITLALVIAGCSAPLITAKTAAVNYKAYYRYTVTNGKRTNIDRSEVECKATLQKTDATLAFAILACITVGVALGAVVASMFLQQFSKILKFVSVGCSAATALFCLIAFPIGISLFTAKQCGGQSVKDTNDAYKLGAAPILLLVAWLVATADTVVGVLTILGVVGGGNATEAKVVEANA